MGERRLLAAIVLTAAAALWLRSGVATRSGEQETPRELAFVDVTVVPMDGDRLLPEHTVVVRDGRIAELGPRASVSVPPSAVRIDGAGRHLMPGLTDAHFHLQDDEADDRRLMEVLLANGVTSILNLHGSPSSLALREGVARGTVVGPTVYTSGPFISDAPSWQPEADEVERLVVEQARAGYDLVKAHGDFSRDAWQRLHAVSRREKIKVIGHAARNLGTAPIFEERMDAVAHAEEFIYAYFFFDARPGLQDADAETKRRFLESAEARIPALAAATARAGTWVVPNLVAYRQIVEQGKDLAAVLARPETRYVPPGIAAGWQPGRNRYDRKYTSDAAEHMTWRLGLITRLTTALHGAGVRLMAGSDAPIPGVVPGFSLHDELGLLVGAGLTPYEALRAATANPSEFLQKDEFGVVKVGARADLLLLGANPLSDVAHARRPLGVVARGRFFDERALRGLLDGPGR